jgi:hypothetical protein
VAHLSYGVAIGWYDIRPLARKSQRGQQRNGAKAEAGGNRMAEAGLEVHFSSPVAFCASVAHHAHAAIVHSIGKTGRIGRMAPSAFLHQVLHFF